MTNQTDKMEGTVGEVKRKARKRGRGRPKERKRSLLNNHAMTICIPGNVYKRLSEVAAENDKRRAEMARKLVVDGLGMGMDGERAAGEEEDGLSCGEMLSEIVI